MATRILPTPEELRQLLEYDPETGVLTWKARSGDDPKIKGWNTKMAGRPAMTAPSGGYLIGRLWGTNHKAHRVAWAMHHNCWPAHQIDHINGNRSDNRIANLREVTASENRKNAKRRSTNTSNCSGVNFCNYWKKWRARLKVNGVELHLGYFDNKFDAVLTRLIVQREHGFTMRHGTTG